MQEVDILMDAFQVFILRVSKRIKHSAVYMLFYPLKLLCQNRDYEARRK